MTLVAAWYRGLDGGHAVFGANDSAPNLDYLRDVEVADGTLADGGADVAITKIPGRTCSTLTCTPSIWNAMRPRTTSLRR